MQQHFAQAVLMAAHELPSNFKLLPPKVNAANTNDLISADARKVKF